MIYWDRPTLKQRAKDVLRKSYWMSLLVIVVYSALTYAMTFSDMVCPSFFSFLTGALLQTN